VTENGRRSRVWFVAALGPRTSFSALGGLIAIILGALLLLVGVAIAAPFLVLGILLISFAGYSFSKFSFSGLGIKVEATMREREHGKEFLVAAATAPDAAISSVIPLLRRDVASDVVTLSPPYDGQPLTSDRLSWIRQEFNITVFALRRPGDDDWSGGGRISDMRLPSGSELAVLGDQADIDQVRRRLQDGYRAGN
jgi:hypothetical protein